MAFLPGLQSIESRLNPFTMSIGGVSPAGLAEQYLPNVKGFDVNVGAAMRNPLSFSTGGIMGGRGGTFEVPHFMGGSASNALVGPEGNKNRAIAAIIAAAFGGGAFGGGAAAGGEASVGAGAGGLAGGAGSDVLMGGAGTDVLGAGGAGMGGADVGMAVDFGGTLGGPGAMGGGGLFGTGISGTEAMGMLGKGIGYGTSLYNLYNARMMQIAGQRQQNLQRGYQEQMSALQADPSQITKQPGYTAGLEAVQRSMAAQGYMGSGRMMGELAGYGQSAYNQRLQQLAQLGGAGAPAGMDINMASMEATTAALNRLGGMAYAGSTPRTSY